MGKMKVVADGVLNVRKQDEMVKSKVQPRNANRNSRYGNGRPMTELALAVETMEEKR